MKGADSFLYALAGRTVTDQYGRSAFDQRPSSSLTENPPPDGRTALDVTFLNAFVVCCWFMIDVKEAVAIAVKYLTDLLKGATDVSLEEVELSDDDQVWHIWHITLSALLPAQVQPSSALQSQMSISAVAELFSPENRRAYKVLAVNAETGCVRSMKIRKTE